MVKPEKPKMTI